MAQDWSGTRLGVTALMMWRRKAEEKTSSSWKGKKLSAVSCQQSSRSVMVLLVPTEQVVVAESPERLDHARRRLDAGVQQ